MGEVITSLGHVTEPWLVTSAKQHRCSFSGPTTDSTNSRKYISNFPSTWSANGLWLSLTGQSRRVRKSWYTVGGQNKDSGAVPQTDLAKIFSPWRSPVIRGVLRALLYSQRFKMSLWKNRPFPSSKNPHFQNEAKCTTFLVKMSFICIRMKNHFHVKGWALNLVLIETPGGTQKWPIMEITEMA